MKKLQNSEQKQIEINFVSQFEFLFLIVANIWSTVYGILWEPHIGRDSQISSCYRLNVR